MNPTVCQVCGGVIEDPERGEHVCQQCDCGVMPGKCRSCGCHSEWIWRGLCRGCLERLVPSDSTYKFRQLRDKRDGYWIAGEWLARGLGLSAIGMCLYWLCKQLAVTFLAANQRVGGQESQRYELDGDSPVTATRFSGPAARFNL